MYNPRFHAVTATRVAQRVDPLPPAGSEKTLACTRDLTQVRDLTLFAVYFRSFARASQPASEERRNQRNFAFKTAAFDHSATPPSYYFHCRLFFLHLRALGPDGGLLTILTISLPCPLRHPPLV